MALEFCDDAAKEGILYAEVRYCPQLFLSGKNQDISVHDVVKTICDALAEGAAKHEGMHINTILACLRSNIHWGDEILALADRFRSDGVVGIDIAGDERGALNFEGKIFG